MQKVNSRPLWLDANSPPDLFPDTNNALDEPNGLLAAGGDLSVERLEAAYRRGIFPWYSADQPILWWSPDPRTVLFPQDIHISRSLKKTLRNNVFEITFDQQFEEVMRGCAAPRKTEKETWISQDMLKAYLALFDKGLAHSIECRIKGELVGGLYGVAIGEVFYGESMFSRVTDASKVALVKLSQMSFKMIDCQLETNHLIKMGAKNISRHEFIQLLQHWTNSQIRNDFEKEKFNYE